MIIQNKTNVVIISIEPDKKWIHSMPRVFTLLALHTIESAYIYQKDNKLSGTVRNVLLPNSRSNQNKNQIKPKIWRGSIIG